MVVVNLTSDLINICSYLSGVLTETTKCYRDNRIAISTITRILIIVCVEARRNMSRRVPAPAHVPAISARPYVQSVFEYRRRNRFRIATSNNEQRRVFYLLRFDSTFDYAHTKAKLLIIVTSISK